MGDGIGHSLNAFGINAAIFIEQRGSTEHEVAAVPEVAGLDVIRGGLQIGLLDKLCDRVHLARDRHAGIDVAVLSGWTLRPDTECHDVTGAGGCESLTAGSDERVGVAHHMICGERKHDSLAVAHLRETRACSNGRTGIATHGLQQNICLEPDLRELLEHHETIGRIGDHDRPREQCGIRNPPQRILKCRTRPEQRQKLLRAHLARGRP